jgi:hypothetical protein
MLRNHSAKDVSPAQSQLPGRHDCAFLQSRKHSLQCFKDRVPVEQLVGKARSTFVANAALFQAAWAEFVTKSHDHKPLAHHETFTMETHTQASRND